MAAPASEKEVPQQLRDLAAWVNKDFRGLNGCGTGKQKAGKKGAAPFEPPSAERLEKYTQEWLRLLKDAVPTVKEIVATARVEREAFEKASKAAAERQELRRLGQVESSFHNGAPPTPPPSLAGSPATNFGSPLMSHGQGSGLGYLQEDSLPEGGPSGLNKPEVTAQTCAFSAPRGSSHASAASSGLAGSLNSPGAESNPPSLISGVSSLLTGFDRLFSESHEVSSTVPGSIKFRVKVPEGYPGVQFRKSKNLDDRYSKYAKNGAVVRGFLEDSGEWVRLTDTIFLPVQVNRIQILEALDEPKNGGKSFWFACGQGSLEEEEEVLSNFDDIR